MSDVRSHLSDLRRNYTLAGLDEADADADPIAQFETWFAQARDGGVLEPNAMTLATADAAGRPSARVVLLKGLDQGGFVFFTNYDSRKGRDLSANPRASLCFFWADLERQVRVEGTVAKTSREQSLAYFHSRPRGSQLGAWTSDQSRPIPSRRALDERLAELEQRYPGEIPLPDHWGGYRLTPDAIEFWQGRPSRLHDRLLYARGANGAWTRQRLAP